MKSANGINLTMLCDFYELTMGNGYFADGMKDRVCYFDMFFRSVPDQGGYAVAAGLEQIRHRVSARPRHLQRRIPRLSEKL